MQRIEWPKLHAMPLEMAFVQVVRYVSLSHVFMTCPIQTFCKQVKVARKRGFWVETADKIEMMLSYLHGVGLCIYRRWRQRSCAVLHYSPRWQCNSIQFSLLSYSECSASCPVGELPSSPPLYFILMGSVRWGASWRPQNKTSFCRQIQRASFDLNCGTGLPGCTSLHECPSDRVSPEHQLWSKF